MTTPARITGAVNLALSRQVRAVGIAFERLTAPPDLEFARLVGETGAGGGVVPDLNALITADGEELITADGDTLVWI